MPQFAFWLILALLTLNIRAAEIVAWRLPADTIGPAKKTKLEQAPENCVFFSPRDELWQLFGGEWPVEWFIWNATTQRFIVKGNWKEISRIHQMFGADDSDRQIRVVFDVFKNLPNELPAASVSAKPDLSAAVVSISGKKLEIRQQNVGTKLVVSAEPTLSESGRLVDLRLTIECEGEGSGKISLQTGLVMKNDEPAWVFQSADGGQTTALRVRCVVELPNGIPISEMIHRQKGTATERIGLSNGVFEKTKMEGGWFCVAGMNFEKLNRLGTGAGANPFGPQRSFIELEEIAPPQVLEKWLDHPVLDAGKLFKAAGIPIDSGDFCGFDPLSEKLFLHSLRAETVEATDRLISEMADNPSDSLRLTVRDAGRFSILGNSGTAGHFSNERGGKLIRSVAFEGICSESREQLEMKLDYKGDPDLAVGYVSTNLKLESGKEIEIAGDRSDPQGKSMLKVTAEALPFGP